MFHQRLSGAAARVAPAIADAAARVGVDFRALLETARVESGFNPSARSRTSSATGLFQFIDQTWLSALARHGPRHGIDVKNRAQALELRKDPATAALIAAEHMADNGRALGTALGRAAGAVDLYLAHFLGAGGAIRFLKELGSDPGQAAAVLFPSAARANRAIFFEGAAPRSLSDVYALFEHKLVGGTSVPADPKTGAARTPADPGARRHVAALGPDAEVRQAAQAAYLLLASIGG
jgi:hypothetical protein